MVRHAADHATWIEAAPLARERDEPIQAARRTAEPRKHAGQPATAQERAKLLLDEPRQTLSVAQTRGLYAEGLEVIVDTSATPT